MFFQLRNYFEINYKFDYAKEFQVHPYKRNYGRISDNTLKYVRRRKKMLMMILKRKLGNILNLLKRST